MSDCRSILIVSDIHFAGDEEKLRRNYELNAIRNLWLRWLVTFYRRYIWMRDPFAHNHLLDCVIQHPETPDFVVANGDYSCDSAFVGVSDPAARASARECLTRLRRRFGAKFHATIGDHELGKMSLFGGHGGMRLASWHRAQEELGLRPFWKVSIGNYTLLGITSSLVALPVYEPETLPDERDEWQALRQLHLTEIRQSFGELKSSNRLLLFCHDPTALPFLWQEEVVRSKIRQVEKTIIGHLHTNLILWKSRLLAGMPLLTSLGNSVRRMSSALHDAKHWRPFNVLLCPALAGTELLKDGAFLRMQIEIEAKKPAQFELHRTRHFNKR